MRIVGLIQVRYNSTRLPGKAVREICGEPLLWHIYRRLLKCTELDSVCCAVGAEKCDLIISVCNRYFMKGLAASENNVLERLLQVGLTQQADAIVRVTGDCLFHDPNQIDAMVDEFRRRWPNIRGLSNWPQRWVSEGLDCEIYGMELLAELNRDPKCPREDFATYAQQQGLMNHNAMAQYGGKNEHMSIDTPEDLAKAERVLNAIGARNFNYQDALAEWVK